MGGRVAKRRGVWGGMSEAPCQSAQNGGALKWGPPSHSQSLLRSRGQGLQGGLRLPREYTKERELKKCFGIGKSAWKRSRGREREKKQSSKFCNIVYLEAPYMASVFLNVQPQYPSLE